MGTYRVIMDHKVVKYGKTPDGNQETGYEQDAFVEGDEKIVAGTLRTIADKLDPPKANMRSYE